MAISYKKNNEESVEETVITEPVVKQPKTKKKEIKTKEYHGDDLIPCRSITEGQLICCLGKDKDVYTWDGYGDVTEVTYDDLMSLRAKKSKFLFEPYFIIEDSELLEQPRWNTVKEFYDNLFTAEDIEEIVNLPLSQFKQVFKSLPSGFKEAVSVNVATQLEAGTFDSIQKVKYIDEIMDSELSMML